MFDVAIIGGGVVGGLIARELAKYKVGICILEAGYDVALGATRANSGIVHAGFDAKCGTLKARLNVRGSEMMPGLCRELGVKYRNNGSLVVGFDKEDRATLEELLARGKENGVRGLSILERDELVAIEPNIGDEVIVALRAESGAIVAPYELAIAAIGNAMDNGAVLKLGFRVERIERAESYTIWAGAESVSARVVINCAGVHSDDIARLVGDSSFSVHARKGEYVLLDRECGSHITHTVFRCPSRMGKGVLVTPTADGNLLIGPTAEDIEDKSDASTSSAGVGKVKKLADMQVSGIDYSKTITSFAGLRSVGDTGDFIINMKDGFVNVAGIESPGLSASPAIAEYVVGLLSESGIILERNEHFNPHRRPLHYFKELSTEEKNEIIKTRPEYAHIICRCEGVTEGEILDALRTNPKATDLDGIKRRTRAQMGRCQGGFCMPYVTELIARELGIAYEEVTKFGGGSRVNIGKTKEGV